MVASRKDSTPEFPANGYYNAAYPKSTTSVAVTYDWQRYKNGDFDTFRDATEYYFTVTAVYNGNKYRTGNVLKILYLLPPKQ